MENNDNSWIKIEKNNKIKINNNKKRMLCNNYLLNGTCQYNNNCMYAHSINEQIINSNQKKAYNIIQNEFDLSYLEFEKNNELLKTLTNMTRVCTECINKKCTGGINCKYGVYNKELQICYDDMYYGRCNIEGCSKIHLTKRGFKPIKMRNNKHQNIYIPKSIELTEEYFKQHKNSSESELYVDELTSVESSLSESIFE